jgi:hypothetical protein
MKNQNDHRALMQRDFRQMFLLKISIQQSIHFLFFNGSCTFFVATLFSIPKQRWADHRLPE